MSGPWRPRAAAPDQLFAERNGTGRPLLLLNGLGAHHRMWDPLVAELTGASLVFDWPGLGRSPSAGLRGRTVPHFVRLAEDLIAEHGHAEVDLLGYSFGGIIAQHLAFLRPDLVRRLVLVATTPGFGGAVGRPLAMASLSTPLRYYSQRYLEATARFTSRGDDDLDPEFLARSAELRKLHPPSVAAYYGQMVAANTSTTLRRLPRLSQPTLVVHGSEDAIVPVANGYLMAHRIPDARLFLAPGAGHMLLQHPHAPALRAIDDFVGAEDLNASWAWRESRRVTASEARKALLAADLRAAQPIGTVNAVFRTLAAPRLGTAHQAGRGDAARPGGRR